ncbi:carbohydrate ABC transporter permease [Caproicibacter fermentans]|nr:carbohydrate ABC transporter permease [Caproicibacter fermentans]
MKTSKLSGIFIQIVCIFLCLIILFPILYALSISLMRPEDVLTLPPNLLPPSVTFGSYIQLITKTIFGRYMLNSFLMSLVCSTVRVLLAGMAAFAFSFYEFKGKKILFALTMATMMIPPDVLIVSNYTTISKAGLINTYLGMCSIFLVSASNIFLFRQQFKVFTSSLREAAYIDGCGNFKFLIHILAPISRPIIITVFVSSFIDIWNQYLWPLLVTNQDEMRTIQVGITMLKDRDSTDFGPVMASTIVALLPIILLFLIFQPKIISGMMSGAVKE